MAINERIDGHDPPLFAGGLPGRYGHRLLPVCCPDVADPTFGTTIRIARVHRHCCLSWRAGDLQFLWTVGDRW
jgi:hypothetical protein